MTRCIFFALVSSLALGCGGAQDAGAGEEGIDPARLYPLQEGNVWSYDVDTGIETVLGTFRVVDVQGPRASVEVNGGVETLVYETTPEGIRRPNEEVWVLKRPVQVGARWPAPGGREAEVLSIDARVEVFAGTFEDCVEVREADARQTVTTTYCPDVGPVVLVTEATSEYGGATARVENRPEVDFLYFTMGEMAQAVSDAA